MFIIIICQQQQRRRRRQQNWTSDSNNLTGSIPSEIGQLTSLTSLLLGKSAVEIIIVYNCLCFLCMFTNRISILCHVYLLFMIHYLLIFFFSFSVFQKLHHQIIITIWLALFRTRLKNNCHLLISHFRR